MCVGICDIEDVDPSPHTRPHRYYLFPFPISPLPNHLADSLAKRWERVLMSMTMGKAEMRFRLAQPTTLSTRAGVVAVVEEEETPR